MDDFDIPAFLRKRADVEAEDLVQPSVNSRNSIDKSNPQYWKANNPSVGKQLVGQQGIVYVGITPAGLERWLSLNHSSFWPSTYADLRDLGLGLSICEWLEFEIGPDRDEQLVVAAFLNSVRGFRFAVESTLIRSAQAVKSVLSLVKTEEPEALAPYHTWPVGGPTISAADELCHNCRTLSLGLWSMATRFQGRLTDVESRALTQASAILGNGLTAFAKKPKRKAM
jgi:hypothetical protein